MRIEEKRFSIMITGMDSDTGEPTELATFMVMQYHHDHANCVMQLCSDMSNGIYKPWFQPREAYIVDPHGVCKCYCLTNEWRHDQFDGGHGRID